MLNAKRLNIEITEELHDKLNTLIPSKLKRLVVTGMLEQMCAMLEEPTFRPYLIRAIIAGKISINAVVKEVHEMKRKES